MAKQTFTTGQVLTAAQMTSLQQTAMGGGSTTAKTTSYVLVAADAGTVVQMNAAGATTITVNTALFAAGDTVQIQNVGAGVCTVTAGTATVSTSSVLTLQQYDAGSLYFNSTSAAIFFASDAANSPLTTKGDLYTFSTADARLAVGANDTVLTADSTQATGLKWATANGMTLLGTATPSGGEIKFSSISGSYVSLFLIVEDWYTSGGAEMGIRLNNDTTAANYLAVGLQGNTSAAANWNQATSAFGYCKITNATGGTTDVDNVAVIQFPNYADTNSHKVIYSVAKYEGAANGTHIVSASGGYKSTTAITVISVYPGGGNMNGTAYLYGVK